MRFYRLSRLFFLTLTFFLLSARPQQSSKKVVISLDLDSYKQLKNHFLVSDQANYRLQGDTVLVQVAEEQIPFISKFMHENFHRCGGFVYEGSGSEALYQTSLTQFKQPYRINPELYTINQQSRVKPIIDGVAEAAILSSISKLSSFRNRYYKSQYGVQSQQWVMEAWKAIASKRPEITVELFEHRDYPQPSVILTWPGRSQSRETVVLGGHGDSIAGWFPSNEVNAPGADDNASGIATITEVLTRLIESDYVPEKTIKFMAYAAEEVGLRGSKDIAEHFKNNDIPVLGVMQLDMTNFDAGTYDMVLISDFTNEQQNQFVGRLLDEYLPGLKWTFNECGYACSDHASWTRNGYPASFPFEAGSKEYNGKIHTAQDTLQQSQNHADHAVPFAKLAIAYLIEMSSDSKSALK